jgi:gas vesicle protein
MADDSRGMGLAWLLAGLGIGAALGILYAPKSGRETRDDIARGAREGTEYLRTRSKQAADQVGSMVDKSKEQVGEYVERGRRIVGDQANRVAAAVEAGRQAYRTTDPSKG